jgi:hypothetical protein
MVKRLVARASLQAPVSEQILTPQELFSWSVAHIQGITFLYVSSEGIQRAELTFGLEERYAAAKTIPGTRSHHAFIPISCERMRMKRISADVAHTVIRICDSGDEESLLDKSMNNDADYQPGKYVACTYDNVWHVGNIFDVLMQIETLESNS